MNNAFDAANYYGYYYSYITDNVQNLPPVSQNGWELLAVNLGYFPNGDPLANYGLTSTYQDIPYFILYNRYSGRLRLFANTGEGISAGAGSTFDAVKVNLQYTTEGEISGIFRLSDSLDRSLDQITTVTKIVSIAKHPNAYAKWFSCDFQLTYDPCVCYYPSNLKIDFQFVQSTSFKVSGRSISQSNDLVSGSTALNADYLVNFNENNTGLVMQKVLQTQIDDYIHEMEQYQTDLATANKINKKVDRNLAIVKALKQVIITGVTVATGIPLQSLGNTSVVQGLETNANDLIKKYTSPGTEDTLDVKGLLLEAQKALGEKAYTLIEDKFHEVPQPTKPISPSATFTEMKFVGTMDQTALVPGPELFNPGTYGNSTSSASMSNVLVYPVYNEAVGVFALLEKPKLVYSQSTDDYSCAFDYVNTQTKAVYDYSSGTMQVIYVDDYDKYDFSQTWSKSLKFKLQDELKYALNPALDIKDFSIEGQLIVDVTNTNHSNYFMQHNTYNSSFSAVNVESTTINPDDEDLMYSGTSQTFSTETMPIASNENGLNQMVASVGVKNEFSKNFNYYYSYPNHLTGSYSSYTDYSQQVPPTITDLCGNNTSPIKPNGDPMNGFNYEITRAQLKLFVNVEYKTVKTNGDPHKYLYVFTYEIDPSDISESSTDLYPNLTGSSGDYTQYAKDLNIGETVFDGSPVDGCILNGNQYTCQVWNDITVTGDLTTDNGYMVDIIGGHEVDVVPGATVSPEIDLFIEPVVKFGPPTSPASADYIQNYCSNSSASGNAPGYKARFDRYKTDAELEEENNVDEEKKTVEEFDFNLYPNPSQGSITITPSVDFQKSIEVVVSDIYGKKVFSGRILPEDRYKTFDLSALPNGVYLVNIHSEFGYKTEKVIIQK